MTEYQLINLKKNKKDIYNNIEKDIIELSFLFNELNIIVMDQQISIDSIENFINESNLTVKQAQLLLTDANEIKHTGILGNLNILSTTMVGTTFGAIFYIYNPHIVIGTMISGAIIGWYIGSSINENAISS